MTRSLDDFLAAVVADCVNAGGPVAAPVETPRALTIHDVHGWADVVRHPRPDIRLEGYHATGPNPYRPGSTEALNWAAGQFDRWGDLA